jgi:C_GCAxxG_C_C family probable redox protein
MKSDEAERFFSTGLNCAQSVFLPFAKEAGLGEADAARIASSFGAGMGRSQETCGAVTGGLMALGLEHGFSKGDDQARKDVALLRTKEFLAAFKREFGAVLCKELLETDLDTPEGQKAHKDLNEREKVCMKCVRHAAFLVEGMRAGRA